MRAVQYYPFPGPGDTDLSWLKARTLRDAFFHLEAKEIE
jgi:hypothetical protein